MTEVQQRQLRGEIEFEKWKEHFEEWGRKGDILYDLTHPETPRQYLIVTIIFTILVSILIFILYSIYHLYKKSKKNKNKK